MKRRKALKWTAWTAGISSLPISLVAVQSCQPTGDPGWTPLFLSTGEAKIINNIAEIILPVDQHSPGAKDVHCPEFVDRMVRDCLSSNEQDTFREGLQIIADDYQKTVNASLGSTTTDAMVHYVEDLDRQSFNDQDASINRTFRRLKQMVILGYFTSEAVMRKELDYHAIPGEYKGCITITQGAKAYVDDNVAG